MITKDDAKKLGVALVDSGMALGEAKYDLIEKVKALLPHVVNGDNQLNTQALAELFDMANATSNNQGYELTFAGKGLARAKADQDTTKELAYIAQQSKDTGAHAGTENVIIRGDNIDALKILYKNYHNSIKMIYIDPPYNTRSENFIYNDNFKASEAKLIEEFGLQEDTTNFLENVYGTRSHSGWLAFMYPRLKLARELLADDGVIFISIDDNEQANLKVMCDEIFGEDNFVASNIWIKKSSPQNDAKTISPSHDFVMCYCKGIQNYSFNLLERNDVQISRFKNPDNDPRGSWTSGDLTSKTKAANHSYPITSPTGKVFYPTKGRQWGPAIETFEKWLEEGRIWFGVDGNSAPKKKQFLSEVQEGIVPMTLWRSEIAGDNTSAARHLKEMGIPFESPKPIALIQHAMKITMGQNDTILDFFAGSGTTAHAVMQQNAEDGGNRKYILVQWDEAIDPEKSKTAYDFCVENKLEPVISSIAIERVRRAGEKIKAENPDAKVDIGYKVYGLTDKPAIYTNPATHQLELSNGRKTSADTLVNMLVATCKPLHTPIKEIAKDKLYEAGGEVYVIGPVKPEDLAGYADKKINIDPFANFNLEDYLNLDMANRENVTIVY